MGDSGDVCLREGMLLGMGNPLLDISAIADSTILQKYNLKPNDAILAGEKHMPLYKDLVDNFNVEYIAGGSAQNSLRVAQWVLQKPKVSVYIGCVGHDEFKTILEEKAVLDGVDVKYQCTDLKPTGTCAVLVSNNGTNRSLCANLAAAECFSTEYIRQPEIRKIIEQAEYYYSSGFFLTVSIDTIIEIAEVANNRNKTFLMNLSAPFLPEFYSEQLLKALPYVDVLFGNETEARTFAKKENLETEDVHEIAMKITKYPKQNDKQRIVIITQGSDPVIVAKDGTTKEFPVIDLPSEKVVDTNGAGDAFVGGFLAQLVKGKSFEKCIECAIWTATEVVQRSGCTFTGIPGYSD